MQSDHECRVCIRTLVKSIVTMPRASSLKGMIWQARLHGGSQRCPAPRVGMFLAFYYNHHTSDVHMTPTPSGAGPCLSIAKVGIKRTSKHVVLLYRYPTGEGGQSCTLRRPRPGEGGNTSCSGTRVGIINDVMSLPKSQNPGTCQTGSHAFQRAGRRWQTPAGQQPTSCLQSPGAQLSGPAVAEG